MQKSLRLSPRFKDSLSAKETNVFIVDSNKLLRASLRHKIFEACTLRRAGECSYEDDFISKISESSPDVVIFSSFVYIKYSFRTIRIFMLHSKVS